ncbi:aquaporin [Candidatus Saccharibacteria bacterium]|nr:aquaporin [Candidatus Saccharibacteria bacterium]
MATTKAKTATKAKTTAKKAAPKKAAPKSKALFAKKYTGNETVQNVWKNPAFLGALLAEFVGVFLLTIVIIATSASPLYVLFGVIGISVAVYALSGAHINPAITVGQWVTRRISWIRAIAYIVAQVLGALLAYVVLKAFIGGAPAADASLGQQAPELFKLVAIPEGKEWFLVFTELLATGVFGFFFARALHYKRSVYTFAATVGAGLFIALILAITTTSYVSGGFVLNPAVAFALEAFANQDKMAWAIFIYAVAPLIGGVIGFVLSDVMAKITDTETDA